MMTAHFTFGPVPSRRLGRSLGVDLVPLKTCTYDCLYCQLGRTTNKTVERKEWAGPLEAIVAEVKEKLTTRPDYITLSGSGEPTLYSRIAELIDRIHGITDIPVAVLTNGSLLWDKTVRQEIASADLVIPSLDAGDAAMFAAVNRPCGGILFEQMLEGLITFRQEYRGACWLEILLLGGYTAIAAEVHKLEACVRKIKPDRVQLNTVTRPPAEEYAAFVNKTRLHELARLFHPAAEVIADFEDARHSAEATAGHQDIISLLQRRPCTAGDIASGLGLHRNEVAKYLEHDLAQGKLEKCRIGGEVYYRPAAAVACNKGLGQRS
ncbi:MAG: radical SAM protein [Deltaproteobacteria bacterium]|nr:radical SAM protein [Deltaproteobacteria bacterium]